MKKSHNLVANQILDKTAQSVHPYYDLLCLLETPNIVVVYSYIQQCLLLPNVKKKTLKKLWEKMKMLLISICSFPTMFSTLSKTIIHAIFQYLI